jgi:predicted RND superfamily exporter protein
MQTITLPVHGPNIKTISAVAEKINTISGNSYVQLSLVISLIGLVAWFVAFKTNAENVMEHLASENMAIKLEIKELRNELPSRDYLDLKFQNMEALIASKKAGK